jgi:hypothetical protein
MITKPQTIDEVIQPLFHQMVDLTVPEKYRHVSLKNLQPSEKSRLSMAEQAKLYDELRANPNAGWAFFAPAGYSKTTCSIALYKQSLVRNLRTWVPKSNTLTAYDSKPDPVNGSRYQLRIPRIYVYRKSVPDLLQQLFDKINEDEIAVPKPDISVEKIEAGIQAGFRPCVFLE